MPKRELVDLPCNVMHETDKAWLLDFDGDGKGIWVPKSCGELHLDNETTGTFTCTETYAIKAELI